MADAPKLPREKERSDTDATYASDNSTRDSRTGALKKLGPDTEKLKGLADVAEKSRLQSTAGKGLGALQKDTPPKQLPDEDANTYAARVRKWREEKAAGQKKAFETATP